VQERARRRLDDDLVGVARHIEPIERAQRRVRLALGSAEGREVVTPDERLRRLVHGSGIERDGQPPHAVALQRRRSAAR
jgi:hypothetical protein